MKLNRSFQLSVVLILLSAWLAGCGTVASLGSALTLGDAAKPVTAPTAAPNTDLCANPLVPIQKGATWTYINTGIYSTPLGVTTTITDVRPDGFTVDTHFDDNMTADQDWGCTPSGLISRSIGSAQATLGLSMQGMTASFVASNPAGIILPPQVEEGKKWQYTLDVSGTVQQGNTMVDLTGKIATDFTAGGMENVTVPAGTFNARKILAKSTVTVNANLYGLGVPISSVVNSVFWFAPGVGWVKSSQTGDLPGMAINSVTELQSYRLP